MAAKKAAAMDVGSFLSQNATPAKKGSKANHPVIADHGEVADRVFDAYKALKDAEANFEAVEGQLLEIVRPEYVKHATTGDFAKTFNVTGDNTPGVQVNYKDAFKKIPLDQEPVLRERLGDKFDTYYFQKRDLSLVDTSDDTITLLVEKLGQETFQRIFKIDLSVGCKPDMDRKQFELPEDVRPVQYKASTKIRSEK